MNTVSIIVPIYNSEKYLPQCIESILNQTYKNFELILVNDGSTDNSLSICESYAQKDERIEILNLQHNGVSNARNNGISKAKGEFICFVDSDDKIEKDFLLVLTNLQNKYNSDIAEVDFKYLNDNSKKNTDNKEEVFNSFQMMNRLYSTNGIRTVMIPKQKSGTETITIIQLIVVPYFPNALGVYCTQQLSFLSKFVNRR